MARDYSKKRIVRRQTHPFKQLMVLMVAYLVGYLSATIFDITSLSGWVSQHFGTKPTPEIATITPKEALPKPKFEFYTILANNQAEGHKVQPVTQQPIAQTPAASTQVAMESVPNDVESAPTGIPQSSHHQESASLHSEAIVASIKNTAQALPKPSMHSPESITVATASSTAATMMRAHYLVQIAAFKSQQEADRLKASLALKGHATYIVSVSQQQQTWYRVMMGPFSTKESALQAQNQIAQTAHITGMVRRADA